MRKGLTKPKSVKAVNFLLIKIYNDGTDKFKGSYRLYDGQRKVG